MARAALAHHEGRYEAALRFGAAAVELGARGGHQAADFVYRILASSCRLKTSGGPVEAGFEFIQSGPDVFHVFPAMLAADSGDLETAAALFRLAVPAMHEIDGSDLQVQTHIAFGTVAWALGRADVAPAIYSALEPFAEELGVSSSGQAASLGSVSRYLGQMATLMGDWERAEMDFARAMRRNLESGARGEVAETRYDWASSLVRRGLARDAERATALLDAAERGARELGWSRSDGARRRAWPHSAVDAARSPTASSKWRASWPRASRTRKSRPGSGCRSAPRRTTCSTS
jgi:hypothetical protein